MSTGLRVEVASDVELVLTRTFAAPRPLVFAALTEPDLLRRWYGARGWWLVGCEVDLRVGGAWRFVSRGPGGAEMASGGRFEAIEPPARLVRTEIVDGWPEGAALLTTVLTGSDGESDGESGGKPSHPTTTTMATTVRYRDRAARDAALATPMERGAGEGLDRLAALLAAHHKADHPIDHQERGTR